MADNHESTSFSDIDWKAQEENDDRALQDLLAETQGPDGESAASALFDVNRPLDLGDKADDAQDFEDISDDDLPEEEDASGDKLDDAPGLTPEAVGNDEYDDDDDLFGDGGRASSPFGYDEQESKQPDGAAQPVRINGGGLTLPSLDIPEPEVDLLALNFPGLDNHGDQEPDSPTGEAFTTFIAENYPSFKQGEVLNWNELFPPRPAEYIPKQPNKDPKPVHPTKVSLELAVDQEKLFRTAGPATTDKHKRVAELEARGIVAIEEESEDEGESEDEFDFAPIPLDDKVGGLSLLDMDIICANFESYVEDAVPKPVEVPEEEEPMDEWEREFLGHSSKKRKRVADEDDFVFKPRYPMPNFDNFERMTAQIAKRVVLDLNDTNLLVDVQEVDPAAAKRRFLGSGKSKRGNASFAATLRERFNISNDEAYDALKENHQSKVRATLGNVSIEHSLPALKLQWPYYRNKLYTGEARTYHRPALKFNSFLNQKIDFKPLGIRKKKATKGLSVQEVFKETRDLSLADHYASANLIEYSEEHPIVLSNFGMGNRIVNYYRRKDANDTERPQPEDKIGDVTILLPEDKSPFANFGRVDPGETVRAVHNAMYRAPIFKHKTRKSDFLIIRNSKGVEGSNWHIREIDSLFVAGQQLPSQEIPGPHARRVTNAAKSRMKMIAMRKIKHSARHELKIGEMTDHITDSTDMQNRQKLKDFMTYDKVDKVWRMKETEGPIPDEATIRSMVKPEDVCVIDAMQVGVQQLQDAGYDIDQDIDPEGEGEQSLEVNLAPWRTSKAFTEASHEKAMLELHGAGDPSGCGLAISMIKTSMKGGYLEGIKDGELASSATRVALDRKANNGHGYNVRTQQILYGEGVDRIWFAQKDNLSKEISDDEMDVDIPEESAKTPYSVATPNDDASQIDDNNICKIVRTYKNEYGQLYEKDEEVTDPRIWRMYRKRAHEVNLNKLDVYAIQPTHDASLDQLGIEKMKNELNRLQKNKGRRAVRERAKLGLTGKGKGRETPAGDNNEEEEGDEDMSEMGDSQRGDSVQLPADAAPIEGKKKKKADKASGTTRKCANCGQAGHIKTNKKLCPLLNGSVKQEDAGPSHGGFGAIQPPSFS